MGEKFSNKEKFRAIFYPLLYLLTTVVVVISGCYIFYSRYYTKIYVSGTSMSPTLIGNTSKRVHYGIADSHEPALRNLNRFDVVITYYPDSWTSDVETYKIKRVWGFPGETLSLKENITGTDNEVSSYTFTAKKGEEIVYTLTGKVMQKEFETYGKLTVCEFNTGKKTFYTRVASRSLVDYSLSKDKLEYFLMGDNWTGSSDSYSNKSKQDKITFSNLQGRVVAIQGTAKLVNDELTDVDTRYAMNNF